MDDYKNKYAISTKIHNVIALYPELRVCQIIQCAANKGGWDKYDFFYCPDSLLMRGLQYMIEERINNG